MSQATSWSVPLSGPATPSTIVTRIDDSMDALLSSHSGPARPAYAVAGTIWISTATAGKLNKYLFDGASDRLLETIDIATGVITWPGGTISNDVSLSGKKLSNGLILDGDVRIANTTDATKKLAFDVSSIATGTTHTLKVPNSDVTISSFAATLLDDADGAAMWATLGATFSKSTAGYFKLPDGHIVQYGTGTNPGNDHTVTMPISFPTAFRAGLVVANGGGGLGGGNALPYACDVASLSGLNIRPRFANNGGGVGVATQNYYWLAVGY